MLINSIMKLYKANLLSLNAVSNHTELLLALSLYHNSKLRKPAWSFERSITGIWKLGKIA